MHAKEQSNTDFIVECTQTIFLLTHRELYKVEKSRQLAIDTFKEHRGAYHPIAAAMIAKDLGLD